MKNFSSATESYVYVMVSPGAKKLKIFTGGGSGDLDIYVKKDAYPSTTVYDGASAKTIAGLLIFSVSLFKVRSLVYKDKGSEKNR